MFNRKKIALFLFAFLMVVGIAIPSVNAKAAGDLAIGDIAINYEKEQIEISTDPAIGNVYVTKTYNEKYPKKAKWDTYAISTAGSATIDFSRYTSASVDSVVYIKGSSDVVLPITISRQDKSFTATFSGYETVVPKKMNTPVTLTTANSVTATDCGFIYFTKLSGNITTLASLSEVQWRKGTTGEWQSLGSLHLNWYTNQGVQLYFRIAPVNSATAPVLKDGVYVFGGARASKIVKIAYKKKDSKPSIKVDGTKYTINLKKGQEYKIGNATEWIDVTEAHGDPAKKGKVGVITLYDLYSDFVEYENAGNVQYSYSPDTAGTIMVRTAATSKKASSKEATYEFEATLNAKVIAKLDDAADPNLLTASYVKPYDKLSGVLFKNSTEYVYQVAVVDKNKVYNASVLDQKKIVTLSNSNDISWTTVKSGTYKNGVFVKEAVGKVLVNKYKNISESDRIIIYRLAAIKDDTETDANEFRVASMAEVLDMPTVQAQELTFADEAGIVTTDATTKVVTIKLNSSSATVLKELEVRLSNPYSTTGVAPKIVCVTDASTSSQTVTAPSGVRLLASGYIKADSGKVKVSISPTGTESTSYWRVTAEGSTIYVKLEVSVPVAGTLDAKLETGSAAGTTKLVATAGTGYSLAYVIGDTEIKDVKIGEKVSGVSTFTSGKEVAITAGKYITMYELDAGRVVSYKSILVTADKIGVATPTTP